MLSGSRKFKRQRDAAQMGPAAVYGEEVAIRASDGDWLVSWHVPSSPPEGRAHGATAVCVTTDRELVLVSSDAERFGLPGGRPEADETWEDTLRREMLEEACADVVDASLLGFTLGQCLSGPEKGLSIVRSIWLAQVTVRPWAPEFEVTHRRLVPVSEWRDHLWIDEGWAPILRRIFIEAGCD